MQSQPVSSLDYLYQAISLIETKQQQQQQQQQTQLPYPMIHYSTDDAKFQSKSRLEKAKETARMHAQQQQQQQQFEQSTTINTYSNINYQINHHYHHLSADNSTSSSASSSPILFHHYHHHHQLAPSYLDNRKHFINNLLSAAIYTLATSSNNHYHYYHHQYQPLQVETQLSSTADIDEKVNEHFRRSLGNSKYMKLFNNNNNNKKTARSPKIKRLKTNKQAPIVNNLQSIISSSSNDNNKIECNCMECKQKQINESANSNELTYDSDDTQRLIISSNSPSGSSSSSSSFSQEGDHQDCFTYQSCYEDISDAEFDNYGVNNAVGAVATSSSNLIGASTSSSQQELINNIIRHHYTYSESPSSNIIQNHQA